MHAVIHAPVNLEECDFDKFCKGKERDAKDVLKMIRYKGNHSMSQKFVLVMLKRTKHHRFNGN